MIITHCQLVLVFKEIENEDRKKYETFIHTPNQKHFSMDVTFIMCLDQSILQLYQTCKHLLEKIYAGLMIQ